MAAFTVIPAIDLRNGKCVRLRRGRIDDETVYSDNPVEMARAWEDQGASLLHVVDLDGAFSGRPEQTGLIAKIAAAVRIPIQAGGGLRTALHVRNLLESGVSRAIVGTLACGSEDEIAGLIASFGPRLAIGLDARSGFVQTRGWTATTDKRAVDLAAKLQQLGARTLIYTDTARDGMLTGPDSAGVAALCRRLECDVIASGGVSGPGDVAALRNLALPNLAGVIVGKALYDGKISLKSVLA